MEKDRNTKYFLPYFSSTLKNLILSPKDIGSPSTINGSLLFADLSGFTAMSEKLASLGRIGGEKLAGIINGCFDPLLELVGAFNGDVIKFGGDAFLVLFIEEDHSLRAYECGSALICWVNDNGRISTPVGQFTLGIHAGISSGDIFNLDIGANDSHREHLFCGATVEQAYAAADIAELGQLAVSSVTMRALSNVFSTKTKNDYYLCNTLAESPKQLPASNRSKSEKLDIMQLKNHLITNLPELLEYNNGVIEAEHRILTSMFIGISSLRKNLETDPIRAQLAINQYFSMVNKIIEKHQGVVARLDANANSEKMLAFFGAPKSSGQDAQNCLRAVLEIESALPELNKNFSHPIQHRYGVNTGLCFVGDVGGTKRREYTAMGDAINLAARLMGKAEYGKVLMGELTINNAGRCFQSIDGGTIKVKGKAAPVRVHYLQKEIEEQTHDEEMIGREKEFEIGRAFIQELKEKKNSFLAIFGEPGAGKTLYCTKITKLAAAQGFYIASGTCFRHTAQTPYEPLKETILHLLELSEHSAQKQRKQALAGYLEAINESEWEPLIAPLVGYSMTVPPELLKIPEDIKKTKLKDILCRLINEINRRKLSLILLDDVQWIDDASFAIIKTLLTSNQPPGIIFICRPGNIADELIKTEHVKSVLLGPLTPENSRKLFLWALQGLVPDEKIIQQAIEKSGGNPFYLEELAKAFKELGQDKFYGSDNIPAGIESVITARIDNLGEMVKKTVRTASVIGRVFAFKTIKAIFPDRKRATQLRDYIDELNNLDLTPLERRQPVLEYIFKHILTQEVAYNGLSFSSRQNLHLKVAEYYAKQPRVCRLQPELPARHFLLAKDEKKALPFLYDSALKAASQFANKEAMDYFATALEIAQKLGDDDFHIKIIKNRGRLAKQTSDFELATADYSLLKVSSTKSDDKIEALKSLSEIFRITAEYDKSLAAITELETFGSDNPAIKAYCLNGRAEIEWRKGKLPVFRDILMKALQILKTQTVSEEIQAPIFNNLGICHWSLGKLNEAVGYYKQAFIFYRKLKDLNGQARIINNLGIISDKMGKLSKAAKSYEKAEKIFRRIGAARSQACACANLGTILTTRGFLGEAETRITEAMQIFEKINDQRGYAFAIGDLGFVYFSKGDFELAGEYYNNALEKGRLLNDDEFILENELRLSRIQLFAGNLGLNAAQNLIKRAREIGSLEMEMKAMILCSWVNVLSHNLTDLGKDVGRLSELPEIRDFPEIYVDMAQLKAIHELLANNPSKAFKWQLEAYKIALRRDLTLSIVEISAVCQGIDLFAKLPVKIRQKALEHIARLESNMDDQTKQRHNALIRNRIERLQMIRIPAAAPPKGPKKYWPFPIISGQIPHFGSRVWLLSFSRCGFNIICRFGL